MEQGMQFKTAMFGGFEKAAVLKFIGEQIEERTLAENEYKQQIETLSEKAERFEQAANEYEKRVAHLEESLVERDSRMNRAEALAQELTAQVEKLSAALREKDREVQIQLERNRQLQQKAEEMEQKAVKYDAVSGEVGELLLEARKDAAAMQRQAQQQAEALVGGAHTGAVAYRNLFGTVGQEMTSLHETVRTAQQQLEEQMQALEAQMQQMLGELNRGIEALEAEQGTLFACAQEPLAAEQPTAEEEHAEEAPAVDIFFR